MISSCSSKNVETEQKISVQQIAEIKSVGGGKPPIMLLRAALFGPEFNTYNLRKRSSSSTPGPSYLLPITTLKRSYRKKRGSYLTTKRMYPCREWLEDERRLEELLNKNDKPMLEVPKWKVKEFTGLYKIEGTEDLSDDAFMKRHSKLEYKGNFKPYEDYKKEIQKEQEHEEVFSFHPMPKDVKFIQLKDDIPVQPFGAKILKIVPNDQFKLPWLVDGKTTQILLNSDGDKVQNSHFILKEKCLGQQSGTSRTRKKIPKLGSNTNNTKNQK